ncbi:endopeptidase La [Ranunculus cassubicifolius]
MVRSHLQFSPPPFLSPKTFKSKTLLLHRFLSNLPAMSNENAEISNSNYPIPLSPPLPAISKQIELSRAMSSSSTSSQFTLSSTHIIFQDDYFIIVNKPQGIYCENLLSSIPQFLNKSMELHLANRLDRDTSVAGKMVQAFTNHKVRKTYIALCVGLAPKWDKISVRSGHGRSKFGVWRVYAASDVDRSLPGGSRVRDMATTFEVLSINGKGEFKEAKPKEDEFVVIEDKGVVCGASEENDEVLVRAYPRSGRTHQIRLHCQYLGIPIMGDVKYQGVYEWKGRTFDGHLLHAETLSFQHPVTGQQLEFRAPLPLWASQALKASLEEG